MRIIITGHKGQLGRALWRILESDHALLGMDLPEHDITDGTMTAQTVKPSGRTSSCIQPP